MEKYSRTFYVIFDKRRHKHWWNIATTKDFDHCHVLTQTLGGVASIEHLRGGTQVNEVDSTIGQALQVYIDIGVTAIVMIKTDYYNFTNMRFRGIFNCVTMVKSLLADKSWHITPKGLFKHLSKKGIVIYGRS